MELRNQIFRSIVIKNTLLILFFSFILYPAQTKKGPNQIINLSSNAHVETILEAGLKELSIKGVTLTIVDLNQGLKLPGKKGFTIQEAYIVNPYNKDYTIFFNPKNNIFDTIEILAHELIHLNQFHSGRLKILEEGGIIFEGDTTSLENITYLNRGWEREAFIGAI